ncbi:MAG TPA: PKD domain-containing protein [Chitinophagales bacterium]|nr:PKD domain-containing protein [Chitinophagales bacterium]
MRQLFFIPAVLLCLYSSAQITIVSSDMPSAGDTFHSLRDTLPVGFSIGQKGPNRTWDFSNLNAHVQVTTYAVAPSSTPYASDFPNANLALTNDFSGFVYYRNTVSALKVEGFAANDPNLGIISVNFNPIPDQYHFPMTYLTSFSGSSGFQESKNYNQLPPNIQQQIDDALSGIPGASVTQVRVTFTSNYTDTIDAWGTVITPIGTYQALRRKRIENSTTIIEAQVQITFPPSTFWYEIANVPSATTEHMWLNDLTELPLVTLGYDSLRNIVSVTYSTLPPPPIAGFTWHNSVGGLVNFTNTSQNSPTAFDWDFGDGSPHSTLQHPSHIYASNGSYYVCLMVSNTSGTNTYCDSVRVAGISPVNNPPVAVRDSAHIDYPAIATINLLANDFDPDGNNITFNFPFPPLNGTVTSLGNGLIEYEANASFRGIDSFQYKISDDGSPVKSDTGTVVVRVDGLPFANFTYSGNGLTVQFMNSSSGYDNVFWDLGDGDTASTNTVVHTYATAGTYTVCLIAMNAFGEDSTCKAVSVPITGIVSVQDENIRIYPNPTSGELFIQTGNRQISKAELFDLSGKLISTQYPPPSAKPSFDLSNVPQGFYICKLTARDGKATVARVIKE